MSTDKQSKEDLQAQKASETTKTPQEEIDLKEAIEEIKKKLEAQNKQSTEYLDLLQRTQADFINYKNRVEKEISGIVLLEKAKFLSDFLGYRDNIVQAIDKETNQEAKNALETMLDSYDVILKRQGVERLDVLGKDFDFNICDCVLKQDCRPDKQNKVLAVVQDGFTLNNKLIKPAKVVVGVCKDKGEEK